MLWLTLALAAALAGGLIAFAVGAANRERRRTTWRRVIATALLWAWGLWIAVMTLTPRTHGGSDLNLKPLDLTNHIDVVDFILNMLVFAPIGILLAIRGARFWVALVVGLGGSLSIEITQYLLATGRTADINDLVSNTTGCLLGFIATAGILAAAKRRQVRVLEPAA